MPYYRSKSNFKLGDRIVDMNDPVAPHEVEDSAGAERTLLGIGMIVEDPSAEEDYNKLFGQNDEEEESNDEEEVNATDTAIELAREEDIDLEDVEGTGANGKILKKDVEQFIRERYDEGEDEGEAIEEA